jgi:hypothetical protein
METERFKMRLRTIAHVPLKAVFRELHGELMHHPVS